MKEEIDQERIWSIAAKIINICILVPGGKFHVDHIIRANHISDNERNHTSQKLAWSLPLQLLEDPNSPLSQQLVHS